MNMRTKSAIVVFVGLAIAFTSMLVFDYTDNYVENRFVEAIDERREVPGKNFSLDALMEYYDWDSVCLFLPGHVHDLKNRLGRPYKGKKLGENQWSLVFIKGKAVQIEVLVDSDFLQPPDLPDATCLARWAAIFHLEIGQDGRLFLKAVGH